MLICLFGESCTGKSTIAGEIVEKTGASLYTGNDYKRMAKNEDEAKRLFAQTLKDALGETNAVYVASELNQLAFVPEGALRVLVSAPLELIKQRFAGRTGGTLPPPVAAMLEKKHGLFDKEAHDAHIESGKQSAAEACGLILAKAGK